VFNLDSAGVTQGPRERILVEQQPSQSGLKRGCLEGAQGFRIDLSIHGRDSGHIAVNARTDKRDCAQGRSLCLLAVW
jgi:hypothetical protein